MDYAYRKHNYFMNYVKDNVCRGDCDGAGHIYVHVDNNMVKANFNIKHDNIKFYKLIWHAADLSKDGWKLLPCIDCSGSGKVSNER